ncbi:hypothetical protein OS493_003901 [Desmophyllum pertusum]|uniref:Uncharacterized protein n=1 Tax=Desmophyllum pertusum TaxID=174260 RepID=A0A9W9ZS56_9CNID|nr:hypothetical protein OS493_003901 [Desmophyllum pertusum]
MRMERFKAIDDSAIIQKENNPSMAKDGKERSVQREVLVANANLNFVPQGGAKSQQPLKVRNMAAPSQNQKPHDQAQLLEKFRKLRQWQQQQQDSMLRQQQQQMETLKMEQNKLQSILAAQKRLQEQQSTSSLTAVRSPNLGTTSSQVDTMRQSPMTAQSQPQPIARVQVPMSMVTRGEVESDGYELGGDNSNVLPRSIPTSSASPVVMNQGDLEVQMRHVDSQQYYGTVPQLTANDKERFEGSLASFNQTVLSYDVELIKLPPSPGCNSSFCWHKVCTFSRAACSWFNKLKQPCAPFGDEC